MPRDLSDDNASGGGGVDDGLTNGEHNSELGDCNHAGHNTSTLLVGSKCNGATKKVFKRIC